MIIDSEKIPLARVGLRAKRLTVANVFIRAGSKCGYQRRRMFNGSLIDITSKMKENIGSTRGLTACFTN